MNFSDSVFNSPRVSVITSKNGIPFQLPSARKVSNTMTSPSNRLSAKHTVLVMQMGQVKYSQLIFIQARKYLNQVVKYMY